MKQNLIRDNFLYRTWDAFPHVIRMIFRMDHRVKEQELYSAVQEAAKRYPYFCLRLEREGESYRILHNDAPVPVTRGEKPICLGSEEANGHFIAAAFRDDTILFDLYHNLADVKGFTPWMKTVLYLYLVKATDPTLNAEGVNLPGEAFLPNETEDPYEALEIPEGVEPLYTMAPMEVFVPDTRYARAPGRINYHVRADSGSFIRLFRDNDGTPVVLTSWFLKEMIKRLFPERNGLPIAANIPHSLRDGLFGENNYHDQLSPVMLRYDEKMDSLPMDRQLTASRGLLLLQSDWDSMLCRIRSNIEFAESLERMPTVEERRAACREAVAQFVDNPETMCLTYPGNTSWGSISRHIREEYLHISVLSAPLMVSIVAMNDSFFFSFHQRDNTEVFAETFVSMLREYGIDAEVTGSSDAEVSRVFIP